MSLSRTKVVTVCYQNGIGVPPWTKLSKLYLRQMYRMRWVNCPYRIFKLSWKIFLKTWYGQYTCFGMYAWSMTDSKVYGGNIGPTWNLSAPDGPHVGSMNLAIKHTTESFAKLFTYCMTFQLPIQWQRNLWVKRTVTKTQQNTSNCKLCVIFIGYTTFEIVWTFDKHYCLAPSPFI